MECEDAFKLLKEKFTSAPILQHFDPDLPIILEVDASDFVSAGVLSQRDTDGLIRPVAYFSKKHSAQECNYEIYDKELLAIIRALEEWRPECEGAAFPIEVLSDHKNLQYFMSTKRLSRRQVRWSEFLSRFHFKISYRPGKLNGKADALTRRVGDMPAEDDERTKQREQVLLKPHNLQIHLAHLRKPLLINVNAIVDETEEEAGEEPTLEQLFEKGYATDPFPSSVIEMLNSGVQHCKEISLSECFVRDGRLYYRDRMYVPDYDPLRLRIL